MLDTGKKGTRLALGPALPTSACGRCAYFEDRESIVPVAPMQGYEQKREFCSNQPEWAQQ